MAFGVPPRSTSWPRAVWVMVPAGVPGKTARNWPPPYARLLTDAMAGDGALFTREDAVEAAWAVVDPILETPLDSGNIAAYPQAGITIERIGELINVDWPALLDIPRAGCTQQEAS